LGNNGQQNGIHDERIFKKIMLCDWFISIIDLNPVIFL